jgi:hypothetical protein
LNEQQAYRSVEHAAKCGVVVEPFYFVAFTTPSRYVPAVLTAKTAEAAPEGAASGFMAFDYLMVRVELLYMLVLTSTITSPTLWCSVAVFVVTRVPTGSLRGVT